MFSVFLVAYMNRSGSSFFFEQISKCSKVTVCLEAEVLVYELLQKPKKKLSSSKINNIYKWIETDRKLSNWKLSTSDLQGLEKSNYNIDAFIRILESYAQKVNPKAEYIFFKATKLIDFLGKHQDVMKEYNIQSIGIIRDPRAIYNSQCSNKISDSNACFSNNPYSFAIEWNSYIKKIVTLEKEKKIQLFFFENIVSEIEVVNITLTSKFGISFIGSDIGNYCKRLPAQQIHLHKNISTKPNKNRISAWKEELNKFDAAIVSSTTKGFRYKFNYSDYNVDNLLLYSRYVLYFIKHYINLIFGLLARVIHKLSNFSIIF